MNNVPGIITLEGVMGNDLDIVNNARASLDKKTGWNYNPCKYCGLIFTDMDNSTCAGQIAGGQHVFEQVLSPADTGLLRSLARNRHGTPFECVVFKFHVDTNIGVSREWFRHRIACLADDVQLDFTQPNGRIYHKTVGDLFNSWQPTKNKRSDRQANSLHKREQIQQMSLRCLDESMANLSSTNIVNIWRSADQEVYKITLHSGRTIRMTLTHRCYTNNGWMALGEVLATGSKLCVVRPTIKNQVNQVIPEIDTSNERWRFISDYDNRYEVSSEGRVRSYATTRSTVLTPTIKTQTICDNGYIGVSLSKNGVSKLFMVHDLVASAFLHEQEDLEIRHLDGNRLDCRLSNLSYGTSKQNSQDQLEHGNNNTIRPIFVDIKSAEPDGIVPTYDIEVTEPHNFVANGFVVHNSYNEMSTRYMEMSKEVDNCYVPVGKAIRSNVGKVMSYEMETITDPATVMYIQDEMELAYKVAFNSYERLLAQGLSREVARNVLPLGMRTSFYTTINLRSLFNFLCLRNSTQALYEIRYLAAAIEDHVKAVVPVAYAAWVDECGRNPI